MKGGAEFVVGREDDGDFIGVAAKGRPWVKSAMGKWHAYDGGGLREEAQVCYRHFRRACDKAIPPGRRALVRITVEVIKLLDD